MQEKGGEHVALLDHTKKFLFKYCSRLILLGSRLKSRRLFWCISTFHTWIIFQYFASFFTTPQHKAIHRSFDVKIFLSHWFSCLSGLFVYLKIDDCLCLLSKQLRCCFFFLVLCVFVIAGVWTYVVDRVDRTVIWTNDGDRMIALSWSQLSYYVCICHPADVKWINLPWSERKWTQCQLKKFTLIIIVLSAGERWIYLISFDIQ